VTDLAAIHQAIGDLSAAAGVSNAHLAQRFKELKERQFTTC
jgi:hypothetical protein